VSDEKVPNSADASDKTPTAHWNLLSASDGAAAYRLSSWSFFFDFLDRVVYPPGAHHRYIWRGQRRSDWSLSSSLDRLFQKTGAIGRPQKELEDLSKRHLRVFQYASRGRRGTNPVQLRADNEWWALGQHFGLATPLLDWTRSPFAAAYFAFEENPPDSTESRVVYALDEGAVEQRYDELHEGPSFEEGRLPVIELVDPMSDENQRLVSQGGLFTRAPIGTPIERWVESQFEGSTSAVLVRIEIPDSDREVCLRALDRMNINHLSLFPDLGGASRYSNLRLEVDR
jgi:hypothetical protein